MCLQKTRQFKTGLMMSAFCATLLLTACGGGASTSTSTSTENTSSNDNAAPVIPDSTSAKIYRSNKTPVSVSAATIIKNNDTIKFSFEMKSRKTNKIVGTSPAENIEFEIGNKGENRVPKALAEALRSSLVGETYWIYFPKGMQDLPLDYDPDDAYTVKYTVVSKR